ncbi:MAG: gfo/Idh/MocA family oxidoreductase [Puniceicoccaceae bacterium]|nr:MAG: gfo/Idh/MocA family oxidoreductase [Puniceicoccaceae bacterium]
MKKAKTIRVGIIGVGQIGKSHLRTYTGKVPGVEIVAAADVNAEELARVAGEFSIPHTYADFRELLARDDLDAVDVCLHNNFHAPVSIAAMKAGKHVYCEKPMAGSYTDALAMAKAAKKTGRKLSIQLSQIFSKETKAARRLIKAGKLGRLYHARSTGFRRRGRPFVDGYGTKAFVNKATSSGGALYDMGVYHISRMLHLLDSPQITRISGKIYQETGMDKARRKESGYNVEELGTGFIKFEGGLTLDIIESWAVHMGSFEGSSLFGSEGGLRFDPLTYYTTFADIEMNSTFELDQTDWRWHQLDPDQSCYDSPQHHWIAALQGRVPLLPTDEIALKTMLISEGIVLSDRLGREVTPDEVEEHSVSTAVKL